MHGLGALDFGSHSGVEFKSLHRNSTMNRNVNAKAMVRGPRQNPRKQNGSARRSSAVDPPQMNPRIRHTKTFRVNLTAAQAITFSATNLINMAGCIATTASTCYAVHSHVRVISVKGWASPNTAGVTGTVEVLFAGGQNALPREYSDSSSNVSRIARVRAFPPAESLSSYWKDYSVNTTLFTITGSASSIFDITVELQLRDDEVLPLASANSLAVGTLYYVQPAAGCKIVGLNGIF